MLHTRRSGLSMRIRRLFTLSPVFARVVLCDVIICIRRNVRCGGCCYCRTISSIPKSSFSVYSQLRYYLIVYVVSTEREVGSEMQGGMVESQRRPALSWIRTYTTFPFPVCSVPSMSRIYLIIAARGRASSPPLRFYCPLLPLIPVTCLSSHSLTVIYRMLISG